MAAVTLLQAAEMANGRDEVKRGAIIELFAEPDLLRVLPFLDIQGGAYSYIQEGQLPGVAFRGINESYTTTSGVVNPLGRRRPARRVSTVPMSPTECPAASRAASTR